MGRPRAGSYYNLGTSRGPDNIGSQAGPGPRAVSCTWLPYSIKAKESEDILTVQGEINTRWTEHYTDQLNIPTEGNEEEENQLQGPIAANTNDKITTLEVEAVIERSRNCKATGTDCLPNEIYKAGSMGTVKALTFNNDFQHQNFIKLERSHRNGEDQLYAQSTRIKETS